MMEDLAEFHKILSDNTRLSVLKLLLKEELCVTQLMESLGVSREFVAYHLKVLKRSGFVKCRREGKFSYYSLNKHLFYNEIVEALGVSHED